MFIVITFVLSAFLGVLIGAFWGLLVDDVERIEASWFDAADKWIYRNPFA